MNTPETLRHNQDTFYIVDFDRTLADSDELLSVFMGVVSEFIELPREQIEAADADVKARGDSFDTASYVRDYLAAHDESEKWSELEKRFIHAARFLNMTLPGATELLESLKTNELGYGILTYGNPLWQHLKLTAAGFNHVDRIVMERKEKGRLVASWQQPDGSFNLPHEFGGGKAEKIVMIDDKAVSFEGFPSHPSLGYYVVNLEVVLPSQKGTIPQNVTHVNDLYEVASQLNL